MNLQLPKDVAQQRAIQNAKVNQRFTVALQAYMQLLAANSVHVTTLADKERYLEELFEIALLASDVFDAKVQEKLAHGN